MALGIVVMVLGIAFLVFEDDPQQSAVPPPSVKTSTSTTSTATTATTAPTTTTTPSTTTTTTPPTESAEEFLALFNAAFEDGDVEFLFARMNQATLDIYGAEQCRTYLAAVIQTPVTVEFRELVGVGPWDWVIDDVTTLIEDATAVEVSRDVEGETIIQEIHWKLVNEVYTWFTDCGNPL